MLATFTARLPQLIELLYDAALRPERIPAFLHSLGSAFNDGAGVIRLVNRDLSTTSYAYGHDDAYLASFAEYYAAINPFSGELLSMMPVGKVMYASQLVSEADLFRTEFYNDWMKPQKASPHHCGVAIEATDAGRSVLTVSPLDRNFDDRRDEYAQCLSLLVPHLARAATISRTLEAVPPSFTGTLGMLGLPTIVVTEARKIDQASAAAEDLLRIADPLVRAANGLLHARNAQQNAQLRAALTLATRPVQPQPSGPIRLECEARSEAFVAWVLPYRMVSDARTLHRPQRHAIVVVRLIALPDDVDSKSLRGAFRVSPAEANLLSALIEGQTLESFAAASRISRYTAKNQLAALFDKTGTRRQAELVAMAVNSVGLLARKPR